MILLDGKSLSNKIKESLKNRTLSLTNRPKLVIIIIGNDFASLKYIEMKKKACEEVGFICEVYPYAIETKEQIILNKVDELNSDRSVNGIMVQLPIPNGFSNSVVERINVTKDVDGLTSVNLGKLFHNDTEAFFPATSKGILLLLEEYNIGLNSTNIAIINDSIQIGKPLSAIFLNNKATVTICNKETKDLTIYTKQADILVSATGVINLIKEDMVKPNSVVIDVGINKNEQGKTVGDVDFDNVSKKVQYITPVPGGVGPMTIASLLDNLLIAYGRQN